jgi:uncharacterized protein (DUF1499 family)
MTNRSIKNTILLFSIVTITACTGTHQHTGVVDGRLADCPDRPNCVSSQAVDMDHNIAAFTFDSEKEKAFTSLMHLLESWPGITRIEKSTDTIHVVCESKIFKFRDDVHFYFPENAGIIHVRSASRIGYSDFGVNRRRIESMRRAFIAELNK